jgi:hypothetical protein
MDETAWLELGASVSVMVRAAGPPSAPRNRGGSKDQTSEKPCRPLERHGANTSDSAARLNTHALQRWIKA